MIGENKDICMKTRKNLIFTAVAALFIYAAFRIFDSNVLVELQNFSLSGAWGVRNPIFMLLPYDLSQLVVLCSMAICIYIIPKERFFVSDIVVSVLFSFMYLVGYSMYRTDSREILHSHPFSTFLSIVAFLGTAICTLLVISLFRKLRSCKVASSFKVPDVFIRHIFLVSWLLIFMGCIPYLVIRYPAGVEFDAYYQIEQFLGLMPMTALWPPFSSAFMGIFVWVGKNVFGSYDIGLFLLVLVQSLIGSAVFAYTVAAMKKLGVSEIWCGITVVMYAVSPVFTSYITAAIKDAMFSVTVLLFVTLMAEEVLLEKTSIVRKLVASFTALLMCLFRNNGIYILIVCVAVLIVSKTVSFIKERKTSGTALTALLLCAVLLNSVYNSVVLPALNIPAGSVREALSVPFQQTARYLKEYPEDVTDEEASAIAAVLDYNNLAVLYDPNLSDPVKNTYHGESEDLLPYFKAWFAQFLRHPDVYFDATLNNACGFYYPNAHNLIFYNQTWNMDKIFFNPPEQLEEVKNDLYDFVALFESFPGLMIIGSAGANFWIVVYLLFCAVRRKDKKLLFLLIPSLIGIAVCLASPTYTVNGVRYALPYIYANPILVGISFFIKKTSSQES